MKLLVLALLSMCACTVHTPVAQSTDAAPSLAPTASAPPLVRLDPGPPPDGERVTKVPIVMFGYEALRGPDVIEAQPPSVAYPEGTVYSAMYRAAYGDDGRVREAPYLFEWDVHRAEIVRHASPEPSELVGSPPRIDTDGTRVVMLSQRLYEDSDRHWASLALYDRGLGLVRETRLAGADAVAFGSRGEVAVVASPHPQKPDVIELFDGSLRRRATTHVRVVSGGLGPAKPLWHAGDSFYVVAQTRQGRLSVLRLNDRTLRERARSVELPLEAEESTASLTKTDDDWVLIVDERMFRVDADLHVTAVGTIDVLGAPPYAWDRGRALSIAATAPGSSTFHQCTPRWAFGQPLFACAAPGEITMVRPVLRPGWSPLQPE